MDNRQAASKKTIAARGAAMPIDRKAAVDYARKYWNRVTDDEKFAISSGYLRLADTRKSMHAPASDGWEAFFLPDGKNGEEAKFIRRVGSKTEVTPVPIATMDQLDDCTHYVSHCLLTEGIALTETARANELAEAMLKSSQTRTLAVRTTQEQGQKVIDSGIFKPGDLVAYFKAELNRYGHTAMFVGRTTSRAHDPGGITCHSLCRFQGLSQAWNGADDDDWYLHGGLSYTLIHFSEDDRKISGATLKWLPGWWQVGNDFYFVWEDGRAFSSPHRPQNAGHRLLTGESVGHYFEGNSEVIFVWRRPAAKVQVERWTMQADARQPALTIDDVKASATRIF
jgi:hypothetical protein